MFEPLVTLLIGAALATVIVFAYWAERRYLDRRPKPAREALVLCARCVHLWYPDRNVATVRGPVSVSMIQEGRS